MLNTVTVILGVFLLADLPGGFDQGLKLWQPDVFHKADATRQVVPQRSLMAPSTYAPEIPLIKAVNSGGYFKKDDTASGNHSPGEKKYGILPARWVHRDHRRTETN